MTSTTATTVHPLIREEDDIVDVPQLRAHREVVGGGEVSGYRLDLVRNDTETTGAPIRYYVYPKTTETTYREVKFIQYGEDSDAFIIADFGEPVTEFPADHQRIVQFLRDHGRFVLADKLYAMLKSVDDDPDGPTVNVASLRDMARVLAEYGSFADPSISPDRYGTIHGQWRIVGDGLLVISFLGYGEILLTAQADETTKSEELDISQRGCAPDILGEYGRLVPTRD
jgi:hypothetical protein